LLDPFTMVNGSENTPGLVKISGAYFGGKATIDNGVLVKINLSVKAGATTNSSLSIKEFKDDVADATTTGATFTLNGAVSQDPALSSLNPTQGPDTGGTLVTITGSNFVVGTDATVLFGSIEATEVNVVSTTEISCKSPTGTGTVDVTVVQSGVTSNAVQFAFETAAQDPAITSLNPTNGDEAGNTVVTITGSNFIVGTDATVMFGAGEATEVNVASATEISCKSPAGTGTVDVTVTQNSLTSNAVQFTYNAASVGMTLKAGDVSGDAGAEVVIPINISDVSAAFESDAFGFTLEYDSDVLSFVSIEKTDTLVATFTMVNGSENTPGEVKVSGAYFGGKATIDNGLFVNIKVQVKADAAANTTLSLKDLKDDIATATTAAGTFTLNAVIPEDPEITSLNPTNGEEAGGTVVTITGSNFIVGTAATVMFGTNEATEVNVASATDISCESPAGTGTVNVTVTQDSRTSNAVQFTYDPPST
ncbi:Cell surface receptor IPT/TIG domain protein, partial [Candidatus Magnetomorum sp. HK-1]